MKYFVYFLIVFNIVSLLFSHLANKHKQSNYKVTINYGSGLPVTDDEIEDITND